MSQNRLASETSPYLLQHANNPVNWYPWGTEALKLAKETDKPILVSIGYSACHWCHVMEHESFENEDIAAIMNQYFVCIKIDREEHPDVDQIYMEAVQQMGLNGGWPLNVFTMPDGRPFYGGTYFPPSRWKNLLLEINRAYCEHRKELEESAEDFKKALNLSESEKYGLSDGSINPKPEALGHLFEKLAVRFDSIHGGLQKEPKFVMPSIYQFLLVLYGKGAQVSAINHVEFTLKSIAYGGIYDQIGGGFARYSVDAEWFAPHFEKMLYDNAQLLSLYAKAYSATHNPLFAKVISETITFAQKELQSPEGAYYAALDADSEGKEGLFYTWTEHELSSLLADEASLAAAYFNCKPEGNWEEGRNILFRRRDDATFAELNSLEEKDLARMVSGWKRTLQKRREHRIKPGLDNKILAGWNGLMLEGLADAYRHTHNNYYLALAETNANFIAQNLVAVGQLFRTWKDGKVKLSACLEDYALVISGLIAVYQAGFNEKWLFLAKKLCEQAIEGFYDESDGLFWFSHSESQNLIVRKKDIFDNVIPCSNSVMAHNLFYLGLFFTNRGWIEKSDRMLARVEKLILADVQYLSNWARLYALRAGTVAEIAIVGPAYLDFARKLDKFFYPTKIVAASEGISSIPLLEFRETDGGETLIYVCFNNTCQRPVETVAEAIAILKTIA